MRRRIGTNLLVVLVTCVVGLAFVELCLRLFVPTKIVGKMPQYVHSFHPVVGTVLTNGFHSDDAHVDDKDQHWVETTINDLGARSTRAMEPTKRGLRVLVLGDSITFGYGVRDDEAYPSYLDGLLREVDAGADVLNTGISGSSNIRQMLYYGAIGRSFQADHVVLQVYLGNDLWQNWRERDGPASCTRYGIGQPFEEGTTEAFRVGYEKTAIYVSLSSWQALDERLHFRSLAYRTLTDGALRIPFVASAAEDLGLVHVRAHRPVYNYVDHPGTDLDKARFSCERIVAFERDVERDRARLSVLVVPLYADQPDAAGDAFVACLEEQGVDTLDRAFFADAHAYYTMARSAPQGHFMPSGNQVIAAALFGHLAKNEGWDAAAIDRALTEVLDFEIPLTTPAALVTDGPDNAVRFERLEGRPRLERRALRSATGPAPTSPATPPSRFPMASDGVPFTYEQKWSIGTVAFDVELDPTTIESVVLRDAGEASMQPSVMRVYDGEGRLLAVASKKFGDPGNVLATQPIGEVERLRIEVVRAVGTKGFRLEGFELVSR